MICGIILTFVVQSSSIILAILTPLVGIGVISLDRAFSVTAGAQIGTTITGLIAALANASAGLENFRVNIINFFNKGNVFILNTSKKNFANLIFFENFFYLYERAR